MPHFVVDCSEEVLKIQNPDIILKEIHELASASGLFDEKDIKVRLNPFNENYLVGGEATNFIHVFANIMEGRTTQQKANLSKEIVSALKKMFPTVPFIAMNVRDFEKSTYCNRNMI